MEYEIKYTFAEWRAPYIAAQLSVYCTEDSHYRKNRIHSVYFDSSNWDFAADKASSDYLKTKMRVRWYSDPDNRVADSVRFLEVKNKIGTKRSKVRIQLPDHFNDFNHDNLSSEQITYLNRASREIAPELTESLLEPALYVSYERKRFFEGHSSSRLSLDTAITCQAISTSLNYCRFPLALDEAVLEVKGTSHSLPLALRTPFSGLITKNAFSKYYESYKLLSTYDQ
ncbi:MAG: VTC domain-containing protein [Desulfobacterales bacterium]|nr:VTC domain-containing protein [Desulfofustis sp.]NNK94070.1 VTC domain-containing protein [Desulfobacterales bacterium]